MREKIEMSNTKRQIINKCYDLKWNLRRIVHFPKNFSRIVEILSSKKNPPKDYEYFLSIVITLKNEARYISEWIDYHLLTGVDHFYIYDNGSTDDLQEVLSKYISEGVVTYQVWTGENQQLRIYEDALDKYKNETKWMAILDADEFIVSMTKESIREFLSSQDEKVAQIILGWMVFGSSGKLKYENGLVLDRFRMHADESWIADSKPIVKPDRFLSVPIPHWVDVLGRSVDENGKLLTRYPQINIITALPISKTKFRINHYYSKSWEEFENKRNRGFADHSGIERTKQDFLDHDQNVLSDSSIDVVIEQLKKIRRIK